MAFSHIGDDVSSKQAIKQENEKTDFTVDLIWWGLLRVTPIICIPYCVKLRQWKSLTKFDERSMLESLTTKTLTN